MRDKEGRQFSLPSKLFWWRPGWNSPATGHQPDRLYTLIRLQFLEVTCIEPETERLDDGFSVEYKAFDIDGENAII